MRLRDRVSELEQARADLQQAQDALRESEERYALAMRGSNEGLWDWDPITKELYLSARLLTILGFGSETIRTTSHEWLEIVHPDDRARYQADLVRHLKGLDEYYECEYRVRDRAGIYRWMAARGLAVRDEDGVARRMVGSIGDITSRKQRESVLRASEARFRSLIGAAGSVIVVIDNAGRLREFNREAEKVFGVGRDVVHGQAWSWVLDMDGDDFGELLASAKQGLAVRDQELTTRDGLVLSWTLVPMDDGDGVIGVAQDVTRRHQAELALKAVNESLEARVAERTAELDQARCQAEEASRAKSEFVANMSHELRTPLNAIIGFSDVMRLGVMGELANARYQEYVTSIWESGTHLLGLINDILDMAKIEAGQFSLRPELVNPRTVLIAVCNLLREKASAGDVALSVDVSQAPLQAVIDPLRFRQIALNLLSNALKFTPAGGAVTACLDAEGVWLRLAVSDSGIGMSEADLEAAMRPFVQVDSSLSRKFQGTGLGLPLTKTFAELHGGSLVISSQAGQGTQATVLVPLGL
jgi:two-component system cell cycle sensor histidine kinase PleC